MRFIVSRRTMPIGFASPPPRSSETLKIACSLSSISSWTFSPSGRVE